jgi:hypothetical protein
MSGGKKIEIESGRSCQAADNVITPPPHIWLLAIVQIGGYSGHFQREIARGGHSHPYIHPFGTNWSAVVLPVFGLFACPCWHWSHYPNHHERRGRRLRPAWDRIRGHLQLDLFGVGLSIRTLHPGFDTQAGTGWGLMKFSRRSGTVISCGSGGYRQVREPQAETITSI